MIPTRHNRAEAARALRLLDPRISPRSPISPMANNSGNKVAPYDANVRSPLIFSMPGRIRQGKVCGVPVSGPDLVSTMFRFAGIREPWEMHGRDLSPLLQDPNTPWRIPQ